MELNWAEEHLKVIRTLMERAAIYRRALAPITLLTGGIGLAAAFLGWILRIGSARMFGAYWITVSILALGGAYLLIRLQALRDIEPFWSPPTRRVTQALLPALFAGLVAGVLVMTSQERDPLPAWWLPAVWMVLYGSAIHAAGFFMPRGMKLFGWGFILSGCLMLWLVSEKLFGRGLPDLVYANLVMGACFGGYHLAYGAYLYCTEKRKHEA